MLSKTSHVCHQSSRFIQRSIVCLGKALLAYEPLFLGAVLALLPHLAHAVDCTKAASPIERTICANPALAKLDKEAENELKRNVIIFNDGTTTGGPVLADFNDMLKQWLAQRDQCADQVDCLKSAYAGLLAVLEFHARPGKQAWADKAAGAFTYKGFANLWIQARDDDSVRVSLTEFGPNGGGTCNYVAIGRQDGKFLKAGSLDLDLGKGTVNVPPTDTNLRTNTQSCQDGGSMIWGYVLRR